MGQFESSEPPPVEKCTSQECVSGHEVCDICKTNLRRDVYDTVMALWILGETILQRDIKCYLSRNNSQRAYLCAHLEEIQEDKDGSLGPPGPNEQEFQRVMRNIQEINEKLNESLDLSVER